MTYKVTQVARALNVSATTVRNMATDFSTYLSAGANPGQGDTRVFTDDDLKVLTTAATMRRQQHDDADIRAALDDGRHVAPVNPAEATDDDDTTTPTATPTRSRSRALTTDPTTYLREYENVVARLAAAEARAAAADADRSRVQDLTDRLVEAEARAAAAERELSILRDMYAADPAGRADGLTFWQWVQSRRKR